MKPFPTHTALSAIAFLTASLGPTAPAATPAGDVESAVGIGSVYLDLTSPPAGYSSGGYTLTTDASDWGWPDTSDSDAAVDGDADGTGDVLDDKENGASDFVATVSGLTPGQSKDVYVICVIKDNSYDFSWGRPAEALTTVANLKDTGIPVVEDNGSDPDLYAQFIGAFTADASGNITVHLGKGGTARTELDGFVLVPPPDPVVAISEFTVDPESILPGQSVIFSWRISPAAESAVIDGVGSIIAETDPAGIGNLEWTPTTTTAYTLTVTLDGGAQETAQVTVDVGLLAAFTATPDPVNAGEASTLSWQVRTDATVTISPDPGPTTTTDGIGSIQVSPGITTSYTLTATVEPDSESARTTVNVLGPASVNATYAPPAGGWDCLFEGDVLPTALGWDHNNGSDEWDGSAPGEPGGAPGGAGVFSEGDDLFLRIQDTGDPRGYGFPDPGNRKVYFTKDLSAELPGFDPLTDGVTLYFRTRLPSVNGLPLDDFHPDGGVTAAWSGPDGGRTHNFGKGNFGVREVTAGGIVSFSPSAASDTAGEGLTMNRLNGSVPAEDVDDTSTTGTPNLLAVATGSWHDYWITLTPDTSGGGTHRADIYLNGSTSPTTFHLTAGTGNDEDYNYLAMGFGETFQEGAIDVDFFYAKQAVHTPGGPTPFAITEIVYLPGATPQAEITFPSEPGEEFIIERTPNAAPGWEELRIDFPAAIAPATSTTYTDSDLVGVPTMIYRVTRK